MPAAAANTDATFTRGEQTGQQWLSRPVLIQPDGVRFRARTA